MKVVDITDDSRDVLNIDSGKAKVGEGKHLQVPSSRGAWGAKDENVSSDVRASHDRNSSMHSDLASFLHPQSVDTRPTIIMHQSNIPKQIDTRPTMVNI